MLHHFPSPYDDEILYSCFSRYHARCLGHSYVQTVQELFGVKRHSITSIIFPSCLDYFHSQLSPLTLLSTDRLIEDYSLLPFYRPFFPQSASARP